MTSTDYMYVLCWVLFVTLIIVLCTSFPKQAIAWIRDRGERTVTAHMVFVLGTNTTAVMDLSSELVNASLFTANGEKVQRSQCPVWFWSVDDHVSTHMYHLLRGESSTVLDSHTWTGKTDCWSYQQTKKCLVCLHAVLAIFVHWCG